MKKNALLEGLYHKPPIDLEELVAKLKVLAEKIRPMVCDTTLYLHKANKEGKVILLEGQLGSLRDPDHGIYPYTTSSSPWRVMLRGRGRIPPGHDGYLLRYQGILQRGGRGPLCGAAHRTGGG